MSQEPSIRGFFSLAGIHNELGKCFNSTSLLCQWTTYRL